MKPIKAPSYRATMIGGWWKGLTTRRKFLGVAAGAALTAGGAYAAYKTGILGEPIAPPSVGQPQISSILLEAGRVALPEHEKFMATFTKHLNQALSQKYFVKELDYAGEAIHLIQSRTQGQQIVSEGFGYAMSTVVNYAKRLYAEFQKTGNPKFKMRAQGLQEEYNALLRGVLLTFNRNGLPGWRCYYYQAPQEGTAAFVDQGGKYLRRPTRIFTNADGQLMEEGIELRSDPETYSAVDADIYIAGAAIGAEGLVEAGFWEASPDFTIPSFLRNQIKPAEGWSNRTYPEKITYRTFTEFIAAGIKNFDVEKKGERLILRVSDMWGGGNPDFRGGDTKGAVTANDSYSLLNELYSLAQRFPHDRKFFLQLRKDSFDRIKAAYDFGQKLYGQLVSRGLETEKTTVRLESDERELFLSLLYKITPTKKDSELPQVTKKKQLNALNGLRYEEGHLILDKESYQVYQDGSWEINREVFLFVMQKIGEYGVHHFLPDQVEVEVDKDGNYKVRFERNALNLSFTEGYDAVRIYAEIGKDLLMHNDTKDDNVPKEYKISGDEFAFLSKIIRLPHRNPLEVRANRYHNAVAISSYFMAAAGVAAHRQDLEQNHKDVIRFYNFMQRLLGYDIFDTEEDIPQYYNAMLSLKNLSEFLAGKSKITARPAERKLEKLTRVQPEREFKDPLYGHQDFDYAALAIKSDFQRFMRVLIKLGVIKADPKDKKISLSRIKAMHNLHQAIGAKKDNNPATRMNLIKAYMGAGAYHSALREAFLTLRDMPEAQKELDIKLLRNTIRILVDIMQIFNISSFQISDLLEWLVEREAVGTNKRRYLELALLHEYNYQRRIGFAKRIREKIGTPKKDPLEKLRHVVDLGPIGKNPLLRKEFITNLLVENIFTVARDYDITSFDPPGGKPGAYREREYHYGQAFYLLSELLGKDFPSNILKNVTQDKLRQKMWGIGEKRPRRSLMIRIKKLAQAGLTADLKPRLLFSLGQILQQMAYDQNDSIGSRDFYSKEIKGDKSWSKYWDQNRPHLFAEYYQVIQNTDRAIKVFKHALEKELRKDNKSKGIQDPAFLSLVLDHIKDAYQYKIVVLQQIAQEASTSYNADVMGRGVSEEKYKNIFEDANKEIGRVIDDIEKLSKAIDSRYSRPFNTRVSSGDKNDVIDRALIRIVNSESMRSPDPRNINYMNWIRKLVGVYSNAGIKTGQKRFFDLALNLTTKIFDVDVSNKRLKSLFIVELTLQMADVLFNYQEIQRKTGKISDKDLLKLKQQRRSMIALFNVLLNPDKEIVFRPGMDKRVIAMCTYIRKEIGKSIKEVYKTDPTQKAKVHVAFGDLLWWGETYDSKKVKLALIQYKQALRIDPINPGALLGAADLYSVDQNIEEGILLFARSLSAIRGQANQKVNSERIQGLLKQFGLRIAEERKIGRISKAEQTLMVRIQKAQAYLARAKGDLTQDILDYLNEIFKDY
ncbi:hypothetical protein ACFL52_02945 [Candidatus Margulisiibacteriota bacterium]